MSDVPRVVKRTSSGDKGRFWMQKDDARLASDLVTWAQNVETIQWDRRQLLYGYYRAVIGQNTCYSYNFSSVSRPAQIARLSRARFRAPIKNVIASSYSAINNRVYKSRVALQVVPDAGNNDAELQARTQTRYVDAIFGGSLWQQIEETAQDAFTTGKGFLLVWNGVDGEEFETVIVKPDEVLVDPSEASIDDVRTMVIRLFVNRYTLCERFPDFEKEIMAAPPAELGFGATAQTSDVITLRIGWHIGGPKAGVFAVVLEPNIALKVERKEVKRFPVAELPYERLGFWGKGAVQDALPLQVEHDRMSRAFAENMIRYAWPKVIVYRGSQVNEGEIAGASSRFIHCNPGQDPKFVVPETITPDQFRYVDGLEKSIRDMIGVSEQEIAATPGGADESGRAKLIQDQVTDRRHIQLLQHFEDYVMDIGYLAIEAAKETHPSMVLVGDAKQAIDYPTFDGDTKLMPLFPLSAFGGSLADRQDKLDRALAQGRIDKETYNRVTASPDVSMLQDLQSADHDLTTHKLDRIVERGEAGYSPPSGLGNLQAQFEECSTRILYEMRREKIDEKRITLLFRYLEQLEDLLGDAAPPAPAALPGAALPPGAAAPNAATLPPAFAGQ